MNILSLFEYFERFVIRNFYNTFSRKTVLLTTIELAHPISSIVHFKDHSELEFLAL